jgi:hypothetical protein
VQCRGRARARRRDKESERERKKEGERARVKAREQDLVSDVAHPVHVPLEGFSYPLDGTRILRILRPQSEAVLLLARAHLVQRVMVIVLERHGYGVRE